MSDFSNTKIALPDSDDHHLTGVRKVAAILFVLGAALLGGFAFYFVLDLARHRSDFYAISVQHFPAVVGLPLAAILAIFVVLLFRVVSGEKLKFKALTFEFDGASGPVIMWVICFLAVTLAINTLWDKKYSGPVSNVVQSLSPQVPATGHSASSPR